MEEPTKNPQPGHQEQGTGRHLTWSSGLIGLFVLVALYVLSTGPAFKLAFRGVLPNRAVSRFYAPLHFLCDHCPPADRFFTWYVEDLWDNRRP